MSVSPCFFPCVWGSFTLCLCSKGPATEGGQWHTGNISFILSWRGLCFHTISCLFFLSVLRVFTISFSPSSAISIKHITACLVWLLQRTPTPSTALTYGPFLKSYFFHLHKQQLNCHLIPLLSLPFILLFFPFVIEQSVWSEKVVFHTLYRAHLALQAWQGAAAGNHLQLHTLSCWVRYAQSPFYVQKAIASASSLNQGTLLSSQTELWQCRLFTCWFMMLWLLASL